MPATPPSIAPGLVTVHGNAMEDLCRIAVDWVRRYPLDPLENETFLVQSNGMAQWLRLALARSPDSDEPGCGIAAAVAMEMPARFLWSLYRAVLGPDTVPRASPWDKGPLTWRIARLLPVAAPQSGFKPLQRFLADDVDGRKRFQLAERIADLFDQYQVYRADWLSAWEAGDDVRIDARGARHPLSNEQRWQAALWRMLAAEQPDTADSDSRAGFHARYCRAVSALDRRPDGVPRRVVVFGISSLPQQVLEALEALAPWTQILFLVHNPCRYYWADIVADKDLLRTHTSRRGRRGDMPAALDDADVHQHAHPLLAAWGKQGRDTIAMLDARDDPQTHPADPRGVLGERIDLFRAPEPNTLLRQLQDDILELRPRAETQVRWPAVARGDGSIQFHVLHSPQREVEALHDRLLDAFSADSTLRPRDIIVMVPDIDAYVPHIEAVFGQYGREDDRHIPYTVSDQGVRGHDPLLVAVETLLGLPESRIAVSDLLDLLDVPAVRRRFGIAEDELPTLHAWAEGAGVRWGLNAHQRAGLGLPDGFDENTWRFGLRRMLLGYATGRGEAWRGIEPYDEVGGLEAALLGRLERLIGALESAWQTLQTDTNPAEWAARLQTLLQSWFEPVDEADQWTLERLHQALEAWWEECERADFTETVPRHAVQEHWLGRMDASRLSQRFGVGSVNFCTLMPMRAIPFRHVCLLGMNDGDYPRSPTPLDFDLMADDYRPGDRSRREDDRYLFLEALLSARQRFDVSWVGRSARDNEPRPPSVLVGQLRDHLDAGWTLAADAGDVTDAGEAETTVCTHLTTEHPLQPFSPVLFPAPTEPPETAHFTYAREWAGVHRDAVARTPPARESLPRRELDPRERLITAERLGTFLAHPVKWFFNQRLGVWFDDDPGGAEDVEPFRLDGLAQWRMRRELFEVGCAAADDAVARREALSAHLGRLQRSGDLPVGAAGALLAETLRDEVAEQLARYGAWQAESTVLPPPGGGAVALEHAGWRLEATLSELRSAPTGTVRLTWHPSRVGGGSGRTEAPWRFDILARAWVEHLIAHEPAGPVTTWVVGRDQDVCLRPLDPLTARARLTALIEGYVAAQTAPLPTPCQSTCAALAAEAREHDPVAAATETYEGGAFRYAEADAYYTRIYPAAADWLDHPDHADWRDRLYAPFQQQVRAAGADDE